MARRLTYRRRLELYWIFHVMDGALDVSNREKDARERHRALKVALQPTSQLVEIFRADPPKPPTTSRPARTRLSPRRRRRPRGEKSTCPREMGAVAIGGCDADS
jgi:hypothetical protein